jgi:DNA-binding NarL/FixJ family response regulator
MLDEINKQINGCYFGLKGDIKKRINALTTYEVQFLDLAVNGYSLPVIASEMKLETKKVYNIKESVRRKMGINLNQLLSV